MNPENRQRISPKSEGFIAFIGVLLILEFVTYFIYHNALLAQKGEIFEGLYRTSRVVKTLIDKEKHNLINRAEQEQTNIYKELIKPLEYALHSDTTIEFIYTMKQFETDSIKEIRFILDAAVAGDKNNDGVDDKSHVMELYENPSEELIRCFNDTVITVTKDVYYDSWGGHVGCFVPFFNAENEFIGVLGVDISAKTYNERLQPIKRATQRAMITMFFISYLSGLVIWLLRSIQKKSDELLTRPYKS